MRMVSLNETKLEVIFETEDYKEPADHKDCHHEGAHGEQIICQLA